MGFSVTNLLKIFSFQEDRRAESSVRASLKYLEVEATVAQVIQPKRSGRVYYKGSWWPARCEEEIILAPGEIVYVIGIQGITLIVSSSVESVLKS